MTVDCSWAHPLIQSVELTSQKGDCPRFSPYS